MDFANFWWQAGGPNPDLIPNSLRFRGGQWIDIPATGSGGGDTLTISYWVKFGNTELHAAGGQQSFLIATALGNNPQGAICGASLASDLNRPFWSNTIGTAGLATRPNAAMRDKSAWYHHVWRFTGGNVGPTVYINGVQQSLAQNNAGGPGGTLNSNNHPRVIGACYAQHYNPFDGYLAEFHYCDGQSYGPEQFGEFDDNGVWIPKEVSGLSYGGNGFYYDFSNPSNIGEDKSGQGNHGTPSGFELSNTTATEYDFVDDSPTKNAATGNPLENLQSEGIYTNDYGGASLAVKVDNTRAAKSSQSMTGSGKYYCEMKFRTLSGDCTVGVISGKSLIRFADGAVTEPSSTADGWGWFASGTKEHNNVEGSYPANGYNSSSTVGIEFDLDAGTLTFWKNGVSQGVAYSGFDPDDEYFFYAHGRSGSTIRFNWNFGQQPYEYTTPSGIIPLNSANQPEVAITNPSEHFNTVLFTAGTTTVSSVGFQPDLVWVKNRVQSYNHRLIDSVRGVKNDLYSNTTSDEQTNQSDSLLSFTLNGFTHGGFGSGSGDNMVAWCWKKAPGVFDIVTYNGSNSTQAISHNLGVKPALIIVKCRSNGDHWGVYHESVGAGDCAFLNQQSPFNTNINYWNNTEPTASNFTVYGGTGMLNQSGQTYVAYLWAEVPGFSSFGRYVGNSYSDGPFLYTGFRPALVILKSSQGEVDNWFIWDSTRDTYNPTYKSLAANSSGTEQTDSSNTPIDILSNGIKVRGNGTNLNGSGSQYVWMAWAEHPFGGSNVYPSPAR